MKKNPTPLGFHGLTIRSRDPEALAEKCRALLGWQVLSRRRDGIVLGDGPELFLEIRRGRQGESDGVDEIHLAVKNLERSRRAARPDDLGGDSWSRPLLPEPKEGAGNRESGIGNRKKTATLHITMREFQRAPSPKWRKKRKAV